jgi:ABC-type metal ion transport system substrate-binding protein
MNAWRINTLMNEHFSVIVVAHQDWINVQSKDGSATDALLEIIKHSDYMLPNK